MVYADKLISWLTSAEMVVRVPYNNSDREQRENNDAKEKFLIGILKSADERLTNRLQPTVRKQLSWYITLRGWYSGRALLVKNKTETHMSIFNLGTRSILIGVRVLMACRGLVINLKNLLRKLN